MKPLIKTQNLSVVYGLGKSSETTALRNVNLEIYPQEYIIIYGPSGCGKSTLLYCVAGLETPTRGKVWVDRENLSTMSSKRMVNLRQRKIGMIFQAYNLISTLNILDNVTLSQTFGGVAPKERNKAALSLLKRFEIASLARRFPGELSGGQQQRAAVARALIYSPSILFADEPIGNLDSESAKIVMDLLVELNEKDKKTIILVTHDPHYLSYAHRVFCMKDGRIIKEVVNPKKKTIAPVKERVEIPSRYAKLAQIYPQLTLSQLKRKARTKTEALTRYLLTSLDKSEVRRLSRAVKQRMLKKMTKEEFIEYLDRPYEKGGVGLYFQTAQKFAQKVETILSEPKFLEKEIPQKRLLTDKVDGKVQSLRRYLLDQYQGNLTKEEEVLRLDHFIRLRLENKIDKKKLQKYLDLPFAKGGVGLNKRTARNFTQRLELALISR